MAVEIQVGRSSEMRFMKQEETPVAEGVAITFLGFLEFPDLPESDGDIDHTVEVSDRLDILAQRHYQDELLFYVIAIRNNLDLPDADLNVGDKIVIPDPVVVRARIK